MVFARVIDSNLITQLLFFFSPIPSLEGRGEKGRVREGRGKKESGERVKERKG